MQRCAIGGSELYGSCMPTPRCPHLVGPGAAGGVANSGCAICDSNSPPPRCPHLVGARHQAPALQARQRVLDLCSLGVQPRASDERKHTLPRAAARQRGSAAARQCVLNLIRRMYLVASRSGDLVALRTWKSMRWSNSLTRNSSHTLSRSSTWWAQRVFCVLCALCVMCVVCVMCLEDNQQCTAMYRQFTDE